jgi:pyrroline-5-carboxylate reductase
MTRLGIIGAGNMAEALVAGIVKARLLDPSKVLVSDVKDERLKHLATRYKVKTTGNNLDVIRDNETVLIAVKPQQLKEVLDEVGGAVGDHHLIVSIVAGVPVRSIENRVGRGAAVIRVMPNTPALVQETAAGIALGSRARQSHADMVVKLFNAIGEAVVVDETLMDSVTALSGSGPAYVALMVEGMIKAGVAEGLTEENARALAVQTLYGTARMLSLTMEDPAELRKKVTSPGGTTEAGLKVLEDRKWIEILAEAIHMARVRAEELAQGS